MNSDLWPVSLLTLPLELDRLTPTDTGTDGPLWEQTRTQMSKMQRRGGLQGCSATSLKFPSQKPGPFFLGGKWVREGRKGKVLLELKSSYGYHCKKEFSVHSPPAQPTSWAKVFLGKRYTQDDIWAKTEYYIWGQLGTAKREGKAFKENVRILRI